MKVTGKNRCTRRKTRPSASLSTTDLTSTELELNQGLRDKRPAINQLNHDITPQHLSNTQNPLVPHSKHVLSPGAN